VCGCICVYVRMCVRACEYNANTFLLKGIAVEPSIRIITFQLAI